MATSVNPGVTTREKLEPRSYGRASRGTAFTDEKNRLLQAMAECARSAGAAYPRSQSERSRLRRSHGRYARSPPADSRSNRRDGCRSERDCRSCPIRSAKSSPSGSAPTGCSSAKCAFLSGVIGIIIRGAPNVTVDTVALALKTGNAIVLRGGRKPSTATSAWSKF